MSPSEAGELTSERDIECAGASRRGASGVSTADGVGGRT